ncbi:MAG TPA: NAD(P)-dependent oxidoreductase [Polyangiaceae bacterium]|nr:NAD(P)-dependent oxidoreductase [Polyangiaceae bacterium]
MTVENGASSAGKTVVVFGGTGFVGSRVVRSFAERGYRVRAASRNASATRLEVNAPGSVEAVRCDVRDRASVQRALEGASLVVGSFLGDRQTLVEGAENVLSAMEATRVPRMLYLSTAEVYGNAGGQIDETAPLLRQGWEYADAKIEAEGACQSAAQRGLKVTLFRPSIVYGPGSETWVIELGNKLMAGNWGTLGRYGSGTCNLIYVDDLVDALHGALEAPLEPGATFNLNGPDQLSWNEFFELMNRELGLPALRDWSRAEALLRAGLGGLPRGAKALLGKLRAGNRGSAGAKLSVTPENARFSAKQRVLEALKATPRWRSLTELYPRKVVYLDAKARERFGYAPKVSAREGIARSAAWYRAARAGA